MTEAISERALDQEIISTITVMHDSMIKAWSHEETRYPRWIGSTLTKSWSVDVRSGCRLTVEEKRHRTLGTYDIALEEYHARNGPAALSLDLELPGGHKGDFLLRIANQRAEVVDRSPDDPETLSSTGLLRLLDVATAQDVWSYIVARAKAHDMQEELRREIIFAPPHYSYWPSLRAYDVTVDGVQTSLGVATQHSYPPNPVSEDFPKTRFEGTVDLLQGEPQLQGFVFKDTWIDPHFLPTIYQDYLCEDTTQLSQSRVTWNKLGLRMLSDPEVAKQRRERNIASPARLAELEKMTLEGLTRYYGMSCQRYDMHHHYPGHKRDPQKIVDLEGKPSELAAEGYAFGFETRPIAIK
ncbi:MAG TPA: hypothetical protein VLA92_04405 [Candidatus Saccharimonadales bacterium]|nr:hypothetical protein [Candidatus Saccharimonadales bacterium]